MDYALVGLALVLAVFCSYFGYYQGRKASVINVETLKRKIIDFFTHVETDFLVEDDVEMAKFVYNLSEELFHKFGKDFDNLAK